MSHSLAAPWEEPTHRGPVAAMPPKGTVTLTITSHFAQALNLTAFFQLLSQNWLSGSWSNAKAYVVPTVARHLPLHYGPF